MVKLTKSTQTKGKEFQIQFFRKKNFEKRRSGNENCYS